MTGMLSDARSMKMTKSQLEVLAGRLSMIPLPECREAAEFLLRLEKEWPAAPLAPTPGRDLSTLAAELRARDETVRLLRPKARRYDYLRQAHYEDFPTVIRPVGPAHKPSRVFGPNVHVLVGDALDAEVESAIAATGFRPPSEEQ